MPPSVRCPICGKPVAWTESQRFKPFCSERCKLIDLGEWAAESYAIPAEDAPPDDGEGTPPPERWH